MSETLKELGISWPAEGLQIPETKTSGGPQEFMTPDGGVYLPAVLAYCHWLFGKTNHSSEDFIHYASAFVAGLIEGGKITIPNEKHTCPRTVAYHTSRIVQGVVHLIESINSSPCNCDRCRGERDER